MKIDRAFIASRQNPIIPETQPGDSLTNSDIYGVGWYTPPLFRRPRLQRLAPLAQRVHLARAVWRWSK